MFRSPKLTAAARDQACVNCDREDGTIVHAHSNQGIHGKGGAQKAHDCFGAWLCFLCHTWLDTGRGIDPTGVWRAEEKSEFMGVMMGRTLLRWFELGIVKVAGK